MKTRAISKLHEDVFKHNAANDRPNTKKKNEKKKIDDNRSELSTVRCLFYNYQGECQLFDERSHVCDAQNAFSIWCRSIVNFPHFFPSFVFTFDTHRELAHTLEQTCIHYVFSLIIFLILLTIYKIDFEFKQQMNGQMRSIGNCSTTIIFIARKLHEPKQCQKSAQPTTRNIFASFVAIQFIAARIISNSINLFTIWYFDLCALALSPHRLSSDYLSRTANADGERCALSSLTHEQHDHRPIFTVFFSLLLWLLHRSNAVA